MFAHHRATIDRATEYFAARAETKGILVGGSIAHGFETATSDVDLMIVVSDDDYEGRRTSGDVTWVSTEMATYPGGYVDAKYISTELIRAVSERGSEPARFAFDRVIVAASRIPGLEDLVREAARYPSEERDGKLERFRAQLDAWHWYCREADRLADPYLLSQAVPNLVLFAGRLILAHNGVLYPYHKWFLRVLAGVPDKPAGLMDLIDEVVDRRQPGAIEALHGLVAGYADWPDGGMSWGARFMLDTELAWLDGRAPVGDL